MITLCNDVSALSDAEFFFSSMIENFVLKFVMICGGLLDLLYNMLSVSKEKSKFDWVRNHHPLCSVNIYGKWEMKKVQQVKVMGHDLLGKMWRMVISIFMLVEKLTVLKHFFNPQKRKASINKNQELWSEIWTLGGLNAIFQFIN